MKKYKIDRIKLIRESLDLTNDFQSLIDEYSGCQYNKTGNFLFLQKPICSMSNIDEVNSYQESLLEHAALIKELSICLNRIDCKYQFTEVSNGYRFEFYENTNNKSINKVNNEILVNDILLLNEINNEITKGDIENLNIYVQGYCIDISYDEGFDPERMEIILINILSKYGFVEKEDYDMSHRNDSDDYGDWYQAFNIELHYRTKQSRW